MVCQQRDETGTEAAAAAVESGVGQGAAVESGVGQGVAVEGGAVAPTVGAATAASLDTPDGAKYMALSEEGANTSGFFSF